MIEQLGILLTGLLAITLTQLRAEKWRRWACVVGMAGQPFWFVSAWKAQQWGVLVAVAGYTVAWGIGIWTYWLRRQT